MFPRFDENPALTLRVIKETKRNGRTDGRTHGQTDGRTDNVKTVYPLQTKFEGGIKSSILLTGNVVWNIIFVACGFSSIKIDYSDFLKSFSRIN